MFSSSSGFCESGAFRGEGVGVGGQRSWQKGNFTGIRILEKFGLEESFPISILQLFGGLAFFWSE